MSSQISRLLAVLLVACCFSAFGCTSEKQSRGTPASEASIVVTDLAGREVTIAQPVRRIVLMRSLCIYELATVLGDETAERLVAWDSSLKTGDRDTYDKFVERFPELKETKVLGDVLKDAVSAESVLALKPDLIIMNTYMQQRKSNGLQRLEDAGVPILYLKFDDPFQDPQKSIRLLGKVLGKEERAKEAADWVDAQLAEVLQRQESIQGAVPTVYIEAGTHGSGQYGNTFGSNEEGRVANWAGVMAQLRCKNIAAGVVSGLYGMGVIRPEYLFTQDPDAVVITGASWSAFPDSLRLGYFAEQQTASRTLRSFTERTGWKNLKAIQNEKLYGIHARFGSHITSFAAAQQISKWLYPNEFGDLRPGDNLRIFHEKFLPVQFSGTWMVGLPNE